MNRTLVFGFFIFFSCAMTSSASAFDQTHEALGRILARIVTPQGVDYKTLKSKRAALDGYLKSIGSVTPEDLQAFSPNQRLAFWINAYNARVLQSVIDAYPVASVQEIPGMFKEKTFEVAGTQMTLDQLENEIIRKRFKEARVHFALNCAAKSCPPLQGHPFVGATLDKDLEAAARRFLSLPTGIQFDREKRMLKISKIFEWFGSDFIEHYMPAHKDPKRSDAENAVLGFIATRAPSPIAAVLREREAFTLGYLEYDWALNEAR